MIEPLNDHCRIILKAANRTPWFGWGWVRFLFRPLAYDWRGAPSFDNPMLLLLLDRPERIASIVHSRQWGTDVFRIIAADGDELVLFSGGPFSWRLARALEAQCVNATIDTPWVMRGASSRVLARGSAEMAAAGGWPFA